MRNRRGVLIGLFVIVLIGLLIYILIPSEDAADSALSPDDSALTANGSSSRGSSTRHSKGGTSSSTSPKEKADAANSKKEDASEEVKAQPDPEPEPETEKPEEPTALPFNATIKGVVVDFEGTVVSGASIEALAAGADGPRGYKGRDGKWHQGQRSQAGEPSGTATSGEGGTFTLTVTGTRDPGADSFVVALGASKTGYADSRSMSIALSDGGTVDGVKLPLYAAGAFFGTVVYSDTKDPVSGAEVDVNHMGASYVSGKRDSKAGPSDYDFDREFASVTTDHDGNFRIEGLPPGGYFVRARNPEATSATLASDAYASAIRPRMGASQRSVLINGGEQGPITIEIPRQTVLTFSIKNPVEGPVYVSLRKNRGGNPLANVSSFGVAILPGDDGIYVADWLLEEHKVVGIKAHGYAQTFFEIEPVAGENYDLGEVELTPGNAVRGRVQDERGRGIEGATVFLRSSVIMPYSGGDESKARLAEAVSAADGSFEMTGVEGGSFQLICEHPDYAPVSMNASVVFKKDPEPIIITMSSGGTVYGRVLSPSAPGESSSHLLEVDQVALASFDKFRVQRSYQFDEGFLGYLADDATIKTQLNPNGSFEINNVPPGKYMAIGIRDGRADYVPSIVVKSGERLQVIFDFSERGGSVGGVITKDGEPQKDVNVLLTRTPGSMGPGAGISAKTNARGEYLFENVVPGNFFVMLSTDGRGAPDATTLAKRSVSVEAGRKTTKDIEINEADGDITLKGVVTLAGAARFSDVFLQPRANPRESVQVAIGKDGTFEVNQIAAGAYFLWFKGIPGNANAFYAWDELIVDSGKDEASYRRDFALGRVEGSIVMAAPPEGGYPKISLNLRPSDLPSGISPPRDLGAIAGNPDDQGLFTFPQVVQGNYRVQANAPDLPAVYKTTEVRADTTVVTITIGDGSGGAEIRVTKMEGFTDQEGKAWTYTTAHLVNDAGAEITKWLTIRVNYNGVAKFENVAPGEYTLLVKGATVEPVRQPITIRDGDTTKMDITIYKGASARLHIGNPELEVGTVHSAKVTLYDERNQVVEIDTRGRRDPDDLTLKAVLLKPLAPGSYRAVVELPGYEKEEVVFTIARSQVLDQHLTLRARGSQKSDAKTRLNAAR